MPETVSVDMSAKVEQWSLDTAVVFANGMSGSALVSKKVKKQARDWLKLHYPDRHSTFHTYLLFAVFIYLVIKRDLVRIGHIQIDQDYPGQKSQSFIKDYLLTFLQRTYPQLRGSFISFRQVKGLQADRVARRIFQGQESAQRRISLNEIQQLVYQ